MAENPETENVNLYWTKAFTQSDDWFATIGIQYEANYYTKMMPTDIYAEPYPINYVGVYMKG